MVKFRKKPIIIDAKQFWPDYVPWPEGVRRKHFATGGWYIDTLEGECEVSPGDWIITGIQGERYPCKPNIFEATYDPMTDNKDYQA